MRSTSAPLVRLQFMRTFAQVVIFQHSSAASRGAHLSRFGCMEVGIGLVDVATVGTSEQNGLRRYERSTYKNVATAGHDSHDR